MLVWIDEHTFHGGWKTITDDTWPVWVRVAHKASELQSAFGKSYVLGAKDKRLRLYKTMVPGHSKFALGRQYVELLMVPPHEDLMREVEASPRLQNMNVGQEITTQEWVPRALPESIENAVGHLSIIQLAVSHTW